MKVILMKTRVKNKLSETSENMIIGKMILDFKIYLILLKNIFITI